SVVEAEMAAVLQQAAKVIMLDISCLGVQQAPAHIRRGSSLHLLHIPCKNSSGPAASR
ncbi:hypothetical protein M9458_012663, partial [Cirrhinus mrigala]